MLSMAFVDESRRRHSSRVTATARKNQPALSVEGAVFLPSRAVLLALLASQAGHVDAQARAISA